MRRTVWIKQSGPYKVVSCVDGTLCVYPAWPQYDEHRSLARGYWHDGGGPGFPGRMGLAAHIQDFLNAPYTAKDISDWLEWGLEDQEKAWRKSNRQFRKDRKV
jgi:hypothetical protein